MKFGGSLGPRQNLQMERASTASDFTVIFVAKWANEWVGSTRPGDNARDGKINLFDQGFILGFTADRLESSNPLGIGLSPYFLAVGGSSLSAVDSYAPVWGDELSIYAVVAHQDGRVDIRVNSHLAYSRWHPVHSGNQQGPIAPPNVIGDSPGNCAGTVGGPPFYGKLFDVILLRKALTPEELIAFERHYSAKHLVELGYKPVPGGRGEGNGFGGRSVHTGGDDSAVRIRASDPLFNLLRELDPD